MPHFIIECADSILKTNDPEVLMQVVHDTAEASGLFAPGDIKVRINSYALYNNGNQKTDFIHIFGNLLEGRTVAQKASLTKEIIQQLKLMFPQVPILSMNVRDFEKDSYCNRTTYE